MKARELTLYYKNLKNFGPIDQEIIPLLVALNLKGYETIVSCFGHEDDDTPLPYVAIRTIPKDTPEGKRRFTRNKTLLQLKKLIQAFYKNRAMDTTTCIHIQPYATFDRAILYAGKQAYNKRSREDARISQAEKLNKHYVEPKASFYTPYYKSLLPFEQKELLDFAKFLNKN